MRKILFFIMFLVFMVGTAYAEITYNDVTGTAGEDTEFTQEYTHSGANGLLLVCIDLIPDSGQFVDKVYYGSVTLSSDNIVVQTRFDTRTEVWYLVSPAVGTDDVVVQLTASAKTIISVVSLTGVDQDNPFYYWTSVSGTQVTSLFAIIQEQVGNSILGMGCATGLAETYALPGQTLLWNITYGDEIRTQSAYAESTNTGTVVVPNYLNQVANFSTLFFNIKAAQ